MEGDLLGSFKPPFLRTSRGLLGIGWNTSSLWLTRLGLTWDISMTVDCADIMAYRDLPASRVMTLFWFTMHAYPPGLVTACRTLFLGPMVSSG